MNNYCSYAGITPTVSSIAL